MWRYEELKKQNTVTATSLLNNSKQMHDKNRRVVPLGSKAQRVPNTIFFLSFSLFLPFNFGPLNICFD